MILLEPLFYVMRTTVLHTLSKYLLSVLISLQRCGSGKTKKHWVQVRVSVGQRGQHSNRKIAVEKESQSEQKELEPEKGKQRLGQTR